MGSVRGSLKALSQWKSIKPDTNFCQKHFNTNCLLGGTIYLQTCFSGSLFTNLFIVRLLVFFFVFLFVFFYGCFSYYFVSVVRFIIVFCLQSDTWEWPMAEYLQFKLTNQSINQTSHNVCKTQKCSVPVQLSSPLNSKYVPSTTTYVTTCS